MPTPLSTTRTRFLQPSLILPPAAEYSRTPPPPRCSEVGDLLQGSALTARLEWLARRDSVSGLDAEAQKVLEIALQVCEVGAYCF